LRHAPTITVTTVSIAAAAVISAPAVLAALPGASMPSPPVVMAIVALGLFPSALAYVLYFHAVEVLGPGRASFGTLLLPPIAIVAGMAALGEHPGGATLVSLLLVAVALVLALGARPTPSTAAGSITPAPAPARARALPAR